MRITWPAFVLTLACVLPSINSWAKDNAVLLVYHHVSDTTPKVTSISPVTFRQHMAYLAEHHRVLPLQTIVEALRNKQPLPDKAVAITFDDGYANLFENAHPILRDFDFHYTIFINPPLIGTVGYQLTWAQVEQMTKEGTTFANHSSQHSHMLTRATDESDESWRIRVRRDIQNAEQVLSEKLGYSLKYFAYPYGEFDTKLKNELRDLGYIGFAQHSGAIASHSDFLALPRFPAAGIYSNIDTLKVKLNSLAMPVSDVLPKDPIITDTPTELAFSVDSSALTPNQITCFQNNQVLGKKVAGKRIRVALDPITKEGRHRVNCTAPSKENPKRYYWFSQPLFKVASDGKWLD